MDDDEVDVLLADLYDHPCEWQLLLPRRYAAFGQRVMLVIVTDPLKSPPPPADPKELNLARSIMRGLRSVVDAAVEKYLAHWRPHGGDPASHAREPRIEIWRETLANERPDRWRFFFGHDEWEDGCTCIVFDGLQPVETWSGD